MKSSVLSLKNLVANKWVSDPHTQKIHFEQNEFTELAQGHVNAPTESQEMNSYFSISVLKFP